MPATALARPNFVDLSANQTRSRTKAEENLLCLARSGRLEAAYNRPGYGQLDLSAGVLQSTSAR